jgi:hypothetical protein
MTVPGGPWSPGHAMGGFGLSLEVHRRGLTDDVHGLPSPVLIVNVPGLRIR